MPKSVKSTSTPVVSAPRPDTPATSAPGEVAQLVADHGDDEELAPSTAERVLPLEAMHVAEAAKEIPGPLLTEIVFPGTPAEEGRGARG